SKDRPTQPTRATAEGCLLTQCTPPNTPHQALKIAELVYAAHAVVTTSFNNNLTFTSCKLLTLKRLYDKVLEVLLRSSAGGSALQKQDASKSAGRRLHVITHGIRREMVSQIGN